MRRPLSVRGAEELGRVRLSQSFFLRDFLHSEIANIHGIRNLPEHPDLAIAAGSRLCQELLEPLQENFGRVAVRSGYRSPEVNAYGNAHYHNCGSNERNRGRHIWDRRDAEGAMGAMATIVLPWLVDHIASGHIASGHIASGHIASGHIASGHIAAGGNWQAMAWWIHDHLPYSELQFFPKLAAFNIGWHERPKRRIYSFAAPRGLLTKPGAANHDGSHAEAYPGFPGRRGAA
jgi:hypothetical protein